MWDFPKLGVPFERGGRWFQLRNAGLDAQPVLCLLDKPGGLASPILDPNALWPDGTTAVSLADLPDVIRWSKFSQAA
jgi:prolyl oligopeptidase